MADVQMRFTPRAIEVVLFGEVLHRAGSPREACGVADWVRFQLKRGVTLRELRAGLRGAPMEHPGEGELLAEAQACHGVLRSEPEEIARALASGALDDDLGALLEAERLGARRGEVIALLNARRRVACPGPPDA